MALFTPDYPEGDRGGNLAFVRVREGGQILNLYSLWDGLIIGSSRFQDVRNEATKLRLRKDLAREKLPELKEKPFEWWAEAESFELAKRVVYRDGKVTGSPVREAAPVLPDGYTD